MCWVIYLDLCFQTWVNQILLMKDTGLVNHHYYIKFIIMKITNYVMVLAGTSSYIEQKIARF